MRPSADALQTPSCRETPARLLSWTGACVAVAASTLLTGCRGIQSALDPAGRAAEEVLVLFWWLVGGAVVVWVVVIGLAVYALHVKARPENVRQAKILIIGGGTILPTIVLVIYLVFALDMLPRLVRPAPEGSLAIHVTGEQWWWRVRYPGPVGGTGVETANEIRLPVGEPVQLYLDTPDVIHSFWIPSIAGKMDMVPGRTNRLTLEPTRTGVFRGACAEYCGTSHAFMSFYAIVMERDDFEAWLLGESAPAQTPQDPLARRGAAVFTENGCGACHAIRGTEARGGVGPDLTHVGGRMSIGAGLFLTDRRALLRWVSETERVKPGVHMPSFGMLPRADLEALAAYLEALE